MHETLNLDAAILDLILLLRPPRALLSLSFVAMGPIVALTLYITTYTTVLVYSGGGYFARSHQFDGHYSIYLVYYNVSENKGIFVCLGN